MAADDPSSTSLLRRLESAVESGELAQDAADLVLEALEEAESPERDLPPPGPHRIPPKSAAKERPTNRSQEPSYLKEGERAPAGVHLRSITVQGFRGIGPEAILELVPGPGLTLVVGRNGSGKSSFAEALELLLTGDNQRWSGKRGKIWKEGWSNLHWKKDRFVQAEVLIEGTDGATTLRRNWKANAGLDEGAFTWNGPQAPAQSGPSRTTPARTTAASAAGNPGSPGAATAGNGDTPWTAHLVTHRPFLSYNELGTLLEEGPSKLYDALASILGLGELVTAADHLKATGKELGDHSRKTKNRLKEIRAALERDAGTTADETQAGQPGADATSDPRLAEALALTKGTKWKLDRLEQLLSGDTSAAAAAAGAAKATDTRRAAGPTSIPSRPPTPDDPQSLLRDLSHISQLLLPNPTALEEAAQTLQEKAVAVEELAGTDSAAARRTADLLEKALANHDALRQGTAPTTSIRAMRTIGGTAATATRPKGEPAAEPGAKDPLTLLLESVRDGVRKRGAPSSAGPAAAEAAEAFPDALVTDPTTCPVCKTENVLGPTWREATLGEIDRLREKASAYDDANSALKNAGRAFRRFLVPPPPQLERAAASEALHEILARTGIADTNSPSFLLEAWRCWHEVAGFLQPAENVAELTRLYATLAELQTAAGLALEAREEIWRPHARALAAWLEDADREMAARERSKALKAAEGWLRSITTTLRNERFAPIKEQVQQTWEELRTASSVSLDDVTFEGKATQRRIELDVTVDGEPGAALGVMSQGELHALALSLFLPRATLPQSPFRFLVIDDPVQAMDPARVDGLARVLARTARGAGGADGADGADGRQVIVFTHDNRLPEAIRRLALPATILEVDRQAGSKVTVTPSLDPVERPLAEARALVRTTDLSPEVIERVVPVLCREALEAAAIEAVRKRRIGRGELHTAVEDLLTAHTKLYPRLALCLFDDPDRHGDVLGHLNSKSKAQADLVAACNKGAHKGLRGVDTKFVDETKKLAEHLRSLR